MIPRVKATTALTKVEIAGPLRFSTWMETSSTTCWMWIVGEILCTASSFLRVRHLSKAAACTHPARMPRTALAGTAAAPSMRMTLTALYELMATLATLRGKLLATHSLSRTACGTCSKHLATSERSEMAAKSMLAAYSSHKACLHTAWSHGLPPPAQW